MELRRVFVLYLDYYEEKSSQKRVQSPVADIVSFIQHELQGSGSFTGYRAMPQRCIKCLNECFTVRCFTNNERPWPCWW